MQKKQGKLIGHLVSMYLGRECYFGVLNVCSF